MSADPGEREDVSFQQPEKYKELLQLWEQYVKETGTIWPRTPASATARAAHPPGHTLSDTLGGDPIEQCTAWMTVGEGHVAPQTLPDLNRFVEEAARLTNGTS